MQENTVSIIINRPIGEVFEYTTNPKNTHIWLDCIEKEEATKYPPSIGDIYRNVGESGIWNEYVLTGWEVDKLFEIQKKDGTFFVRYTYEDLGDDKCKMIYHEWDSVESFTPFAQDVFDNLKEILES